MIFRLIKKNSKNVSSRTETPYLFTQRSNTHFTVEENIYHNILVTQTYIYTLTLYSYINNVQRMHLF